MNDKAVKICLMSTNIVCLFAGIITLAGGLLLQFNETVKNILSTLSESTSSTSIGILSVIMLVVGALITLVSFVGCCGAMSDSKCMIGLYCLFLIILLLGQITIGVLGVVYGKQEIDSSARDYFLKFVNDAPGTDEDVLNAVQEQLKCCGYDGPENYAPKFKPTSSTTAKTTTSSLSSVTTSTSITTSNASTVEKAETATTGEQVTDSTSSTVSQTVEPHTKGTGEVSTTEYHYAGGWPKSCCKKEGSSYVNVTLCEDHSLSKAELKLYLHEQGCKDGILEFVNKYALIVGGIALGFALLEIISLIAGCMLYKLLD